MVVSKQGALALIELEGVVLVPYRDSKGVWTIGVGHTAAAGGIKPGPSTKKLALEEVIAIFLLDLKKYEKGVVAALKRKPTQHQFDALVSFHFNTGAIGKAALTKHFNAGNLKAAAKGFMGWTRSGKNPLALQSRRLAEQKIFTDGDYQPPFTPGVWSTWPGKPRQMDISKLL